MSNYRVIFSPSARADLNQILKYLADNDFDESIIDQIIDEICMRLSDNPRSAGRIYEKAIRQILILKKNVVYYEIVDDEVHALHIRAGKMNKEIKRR